MKEIRLLRLVLRNFKGIKKFVLGLKGESLNVYGDNETGKTSLADAWHWLLFDKDSLGQSNFDIKTLDKDNKPIHGLEHEVEGVIAVDGKAATLKKVYYEKWTKKRGSVKETFTGHTTDYYINDVPVKKSEYDDRIAEIIDEETFQMLTNPAHFNERLHWQDRRKILLEVCGDVSDEDVLAANKDLTKLADILSERSLEDHKKIIAAQRKRINKALDKIPVRIDEVSQGLPDISIIDPDVIKADIRDLKTSKKEKEQKLSRIESGGEIAQKEKRLTEIEGEIQEIKNNHTAEFNDKIGEITVELNNQKDLLDQINRSIKNKQQDREDLLKRAEWFEDEMAELREKWHQENKVKITVDGICPTCGQELPEDQIEEARNKANLQKAESLELINRKGREKKKRYEELINQAENLLKDIEELKKEKSALQKAIDRAHADINDLNKKADKYQDDFQYKKKLTEKKGIQKSIEQLKEDSSEAIGTVQQEIEILEKELQELEGMLAKIDQYNQGQERVEELKAQEKELAAEYERLEEELYLTEEFTRTRVNLLEEKINSRFKYTKFKLFEEQVNGGLAETCESLYKGVSYNSTLNTGGKLIIGIDIINTLSEHFKFRAPIFIDGRESITKIPDTQCQVINLRVSEKDKKLRVERIQEEMKEAV